MALVSRTLLAILACCGTIAFAACGGGDNGDDRPIVRLANTPIPTVTPVVPTPVECYRDETGTLPANFPSDVVPVPPDFAVWDIQTEPTLRVVGRVQPPPDVRPPQEVVSQALNFVLSRTFTLQLQPRVEGADFVFTAPDGRRGHYNAKQVVGCFGVVEIVFDLDWVTPDTPPPPASPAPTATPAEPV